MTADEQIIQDTRHWLERAVIGLNLCPFAKSVHVRGQVHYAVSAAGSEADLLVDLRAELERLAAADPELHDTTLLVVPYCLADFLEFNDFLDQADALLQDMGLDEDYQIADFHPEYQFAGTEPDDISNFSNRAPYPTLHLLREDSIDKAVEVFPQAEAIFERNIDTLEKLGNAGWDALDVGPKIQPQDSKP